MVECLPSVHMTPSSWFSTERNENPRWASAQQQLHVTTGSLLPCCPVAVPETAEVTAAGTMVLKAMSEV